MVGHDWTWLDTTGHGSGHGQTWLDMAGHSWTWSDMAGHGWTWSDMARHGQTWLDTAGHGWTWLDMVGHSRTRPDMIWDLSPGSGSFSLGSGILWLTGPDPLSRSQRIPLGWGRGRSPPSPTLLPPLSPGTGARETVLGTLGEATFLRIPRQLQERTQQFGEASWKKLTEELQRKKFLLKISGGNYTEFEPGRVSFHRRDFSLEILNTSRDDRRLYEYSVSNGQEEEIWQIQLEVFEPVAHPSIRILRRELSNGSCSLELRCTSERGDEVSYSWESRENGTGAICSGNGSVLNLSYSLRNAGFGCVCTARNPVSSREAAFDSSRCGFEQRGVPGLRPELLAPLLALAAVVIVTATVVTFRATKREFGSPKSQIPGKEFHGGGGRGVTGGHSVSGGPLVSSGHSMSGGVEM
ncbi:signaling lymphocytic activation molecule-like [Parus major]|uniref:signaling lymphocytic activation molecule-like n=1 Tax=Parus major TaxID=9157 RepID=UPI001443CB62|nr:signaling lymphocytic activation molecule-like [Parus major]